MKKRKMNSYAVRFSVILSAILCLLVIFPLNVLGDSEVQVEGILSFNPGGYILFGDGTWQDSATLHAGSVANSMLAHPSVTISAGTGLSGGGTVALGGSTTLGLANTAVAPGTYTRATITVDQQGRLTSAGNGAAINLGTEVTGTVPIANGGTGSSTKNFVDLSTTQTVGGAKTFSSQIGSTLATGAAPLQVTSTTMVTNLNAEMVGGQKVSDLTSQYQKKYAKVAVVEPYGHGDYTNPAAAMADYQNWCGVPSRLSPCLLKIMPGFYDIATPNTVQMQQFIDIEGSGEKVTIISGTIDGDSEGVVMGASNAEIRFLTVENRGGSGHTLTFGIVNQSSSPSMTNVTVSASGGAYNYGVLNFYSSPTMTNVTSSASGGFSVGVRNWASSPIMTNVTASASGGGIYNYGVYNNDYCYPTMTNVTASASGGTTNYGIYYTSYCYPTMNNVTASASGGTTNYGIHTSASFPTMTNVTASASGGTTNYGVYNNGIAYGFPKMNNVTASAYGGTANYGVYNYGCLPAMTNSTVTASGGTASYGIYNDQSAPVMRDVAISAYGATLYNAAIYNVTASYPILINVTANADASGTGTYAFGLYNVNSSGQAMVDRSSFSSSGGTGDNKGIRNDSSSGINVGSSKIAGGVIGNVSCIFSYNGSYTALNGSCQ